MYHLFGIQPKVNKFVFDFFGFRIGKYIKINVGLSFLFKDLIFSTTKNVTCR